jgi:hypothetical protein
MDDRPERIKNQLRGHDEIKSTAYGTEEHNNRLEQINRLNQPPKKRPFRNFVAIFVIAFFGVALFRGGEGFTLNPFNWFSESAVFSNQPSEDLLNRMGARMVEMGYTGLDHDALRALRAEGLTATYVSNVRALGYTDLTLEQAVSLVKASASTTFIAMMIELGYPLTVEDIVNLRSAGVTAHFTSNMHDLGYRDVTIDQLIRMRRIGVTPALVRRLQEERGSDISMEEIIRYRISNQ